MLSGWELIIILVAGVALLIWGPSKIPELAKGLGRAKAEFEKASRGDFSTGLNTETVRSSSSDDTIVILASSLGIKTEGKTKEQVVREIVANIKANKEAS